MALFMWLALIACIFVQSVLGSVVFTGNENAIVLNWAGPNPATGFTFLARTSFDAPTASGKYYTVFSNWDYAAPTGAPGGTNVPTCTNTGGLWMGYTVSDTAVWSYSWQVNVPSRCASSNNVGNSVSELLPTKTEVGIAVDFNANGTILRPYVGASGVIGSGGTQYQLPTTSQKTFLFANVPGSIRDIAFISGSIGFAEITKYTQGQQSVSAATPNLLAWWPLDSFFTPGQTLLPAAGSLNVQLSLLSNRGVLSAPKTGCVSASFLTTGSGCVVGNTTNSLNPDGSFTITIDALALLPDTTLFMGLKDQINSDGAVQLAGVLEVNVTDEAAVSIPQTLLTSASGELYGTFDQIRVRPPSGSKCTYDANPTYATNSFSIVLSPSGCGSGSKSKKAVIIGAVVGGVAFLILLLVLVGLVIIFKFPHLAAKLGLRSVTKRGSIMAGRKNLARDRDVMTM